LPGGRLLAPLGAEYETGPGPFGLAISPSGNFVASSNGGPNRYSLTVLRKAAGAWKPAQIVAPHAKSDTDEDDWRSVFMGLAFEDDSTLYASEGNSGRVRAIDPSSGKVKHVYSFGNDAYTGDLALDRGRGLLYVVDQANFQLVVIDTKKRTIAGRVRVGRLPFAVALSEDGHRAFVTNIGMFEYKPVPGANPKRARETGLPFPAFGFPSPESERGATRQTGAGPVEVPGLGDPNVPESNSLAVVDVRDPSSLRVERFVRTGLPFGGRTHGGSSPSGVAVGGGLVFVSNGHNDSITVVDAGSGAVKGTVELRWPGLEGYRGILPIGLTYDSASRRLLVAEAGINAVGVIDLGSMKLAGHIPAGWFPTRIAAHGGQVFVANAKGRGTGPNSDKKGETFQGSFRRGSITVFPRPADDELGRLTERVIANNVVKSEIARLPREIEHVVLIVKENRTFDEVFGAVKGVRGDPKLARFDAPVAPNHHAMARQWAMSDNFYADSEVSVDGHHWLVGSYPNAWTESSLMAAYGGQKDFRMPTPAPGRLQFAQSNSSLHPQEQLEAGAIWHHLEQHGITFRNFGEGFELAGVDEGAGLMPTGARFLTNVPMPDPLYRNTSREYPQYNMNIPDQCRATQFIAEIERMYVKGKDTFPRFLYIHLPNDHMARPRPADGYPQESSYVVDNDYALGRIVDFLSHTPWWKSMAIFVTEDDAQGGVDHVDSHRTVMMIASPYAKKNYVSHVNSSFPGLLKTVFALLRIPPLNLFDATAASMADCFRSEPDFAPYSVRPVDKRLFDPEKAKDPLDPQPSPRMDDPRFLREQHKKVR
jgi:DNA-binding beta-propeller fold protein YncE